MGAGGGGGLGGEGNHIKRAGVLIRNFEKKTFKGYHDPKLWAWLEKFVTPKREQHIIFCYFFGSICYLAPAVNLISTVGLNALRVIKTMILNPIRYNRYPLSLLYGSPLSLPWDIYVYPQLIIKIQIGKIYLQ